MAPRISGTTSFSSKKYIVLLVYTSSIVKYEVSYLPMSVYHDLPALPYLWGTINYTNLGYLAERYATFFLENKMQSIRLFTLFKNKHVSFRVQIQVCLNYLRKNRKLKFLERTILTVQFVWLHFFNPRQQDVGMCSARIV